MAPLASDDNWQERNVDHMTVNQCEATVSIRCDGTIHFPRAAIRQFAETDLAYIHFYRIGGGGGTRPLLSCERNELRLRSDGPFPEYAEDDPLEFFRGIHFKPRSRKSLRAWIEPKTQTIMVQIG
jgi:hypothetical protein